MSTRNVGRLSMLSVAVVLSGCATIFGSPTQTIPVSSTPSGATVTIVDETGAEVYSGVTPASVTLKKHAGGYWAKKSYTVTIAKPGYKAQAIPVTASANGWYLLGNLVFGGAIGWFAIDPFSGNMYTLSPGSVDSTMIVNAARGGPSDDGRIALMLLEDVPEHLRDSWCSSTERAALRPRAPRRPAPGRFEAAGGTGTPVPGAHVLQKNVCTTSMQR